MKNIQLSDGDHNISCKIDGFRSDGPEIRILSGRPSWLVPSEESWKMQQDGIKNGCQVFAGSRFWRLWMIDRSASHVEGDNRRSTPVHIWSWWVPHWRPRSTGRRQNNLETTGGSGHPLPGADGVLSLAHDHAWPEEEGGCSRLSLLDNGMPTPNDPPRDRFSCSGNEVDTGGQEGDEIGLIFCPQQGIANEIGLWGIGILSEVDPDTGIDLEGHHRRKWQWARVLPAPR